MNVDVALTTDSIKQNDLCRKTVIIIDTLRSTSTMLMALDRGCESIIPVETLGQAMKYASREDTLLIGERFSKKVDGFDLPNSPSMVSKHDLREKTIVITTSNGTKTFKKVKKAPLILIGSLLNADHCLEHALRSNHDLLFVCAGRHGEFAIEDGLTAGYLVNGLMQKKKDIHCRDIALLLGHHYDCHRDRLFEMIAQGQTAQRLKKTNQRRDIEFCLELNRLQLSGVYREGKITALG